MRINGFYGAKARWWLNSVEYDRKYNTAYSAAQKKWAYKNGFLPAIAERYNINAQNLNFYASNDNPEIRNLLGDEPQMWENLKLKPRWLKETISLFGNYKDIYDKNLGEDSDYNLKRSEGRLVKDGGTIYPIPFI